MLMWNRQKKNYINLNIIYIIMIFFILIIVTNACSNDFDCFDQCNNYSCNNVECKCDIETLSNKIELTEKITLYY